MTYGYTPTQAAARQRGFASRAADRESVLRRLDWVLLLSVIALCVLGTVLVYSATRGRALDAGLDPMGYLKRNVINIAIGCALGMATALFDYRMLRAYAPFVYLISLLGLLAVLTPLGSTINGGHSWIVLPGGFSVQPSEFAKVALCVGLAMILSEKRDAEDQPRLVDVGLALLVAAVPIALIMLQPDLGTTIVIGFLVLGILAVAGTPTPWMAGLIGIGVLGAGLAIKAGVLSTYQINRFAAFTNPDFDPGGAGYQLKQARIAIGAGGFDGAGLFQGTQTNGKFIPEQQTDFIFTVAGEELGFIGAATIIVLLGIVLWRAMRIALDAEDMFGRLVATGIVCWFTFQMFENIGMTLGIMPMTGVPLPFVSYGGSSMFANMMAIGLLQNVHMRRYA